MKVLYITNAINGVGGLERVLSIKTTYLAEELGYEVHVLCLTEGSIRSFYNFSKNIRLHNLKMDLSKKKFIFKVPCRCKKIHTTFKTRYNICLR